MNETIHVIEIDHGIGPNQQIRTLAGDQDEAMTTIGLHLGDAGKVTVWSLSPDAVAAHAVRSIRRDEP